MPAWDNKTAWAGFPPEELFQRNITESQYASLNDKLNKIIWKLQEMENHFQQGKVPVWIVKESPSWQQYDWWKIVSKTEEKT